MREIDPSNMQIDSDLDSPAPPPVTSTTTTDQSYDSDLATGDQQTSEVPVDGGATATNAPADMTATDVSADDSSTYKQDHLIGAAEGIFGKGAQGMAGLIEDISKEQAEPHASVVVTAARGELA